MPEEETYYHDSDLSAASESILALLNQAADSIHEGAEVVKTPLTAEQAQAFFSMFDLSLLIPRA